MKDEEISTNEWKDDKISTIKEINNVNELRKFLNINEVHYMKFMNQFSDSLRNASKNYPEYYKVTKPYIDSYSIMIDANLQALRGVYDLKKNKDEIFENLRKGLEKVVEQGLVEIKGYEVEIRINNEKVKDELVNYAKNNHEDFEQVDLKPETLDFGEYLTNFTRLKENVSHFREVGNSEVFEEIIGEARKDFLNGAYVIDKLKFFLDNHLKYIVSNTNQLVKNYEENRNASKNELLTY